MDIFSDTYVADQGSGNSKQPLEGVYTTPVGVFSIFKGFDLFCNGVYSFSFAAEFNFFFRFSFFLIATFAVRRSLADFDSICETGMPCVSAYTLADSLDWDV